MPLTLGSRLGSYEVLSLLGAGGMGEVYRARDTKLGREVALKILPDTFASDPDRLARFTREAQTLAALNHPNIAHIHGLEESGAVRALVMELVEGEDLSQRIARGAIPLDEALPIAKQIAEALEAAHEQGIIHRDLKPANIKVRADGMVKVLDFGLAKAMEPAAGSSPNVSQSPTITTPAMTQAGMILGTAAYMSPEQARGRPIDKRTDVWAFGCVLYEMLTGRRAFEGEDVTDTIAAIVRGEPAWDALPADVPAQIQILLRRCLEKDRGARISDVAVARFLMTETIALPSAPSVATPPPAPAPRWRLVAGTAVGLVAGIVLTAIAAWAVARLTPQRPPQPARFAVVPPSAQPLSIQGNDRDIAISPDGTHIVYRAGGGQGIRPVGRARAGSARRSATGQRPYHSRAVHFSRWPLGWILHGNRAQESLHHRRTTHHDLPRGKHSAGGELGFGRHDRLRHQFPAEPVTERARGRRRTKGAGAAAGLDERRAWSVPFPIHPAGRPGVLFTIIEAGQVETAQVAVLDLKTGQRKTLVRGGSHAEYVDPSTTSTSSGQAGSGQAGYLVYAAAGTLRAVRFDLARLEVVGDPVPVVEQVMAAPTGEANFAVSRGGTLVYVPGGLGAQTVVTPRSLVWVNRQGREEPIKAPPQSLRGAASLARRHARGARHSRSAKRHLDLGSRPAGADTTDVRSDPGLESRLDAGRAARDLDVDPRPESLLAGRGRYRRGRAADDESECAVPDVDFPRWHARRAV